VKFVQPMVRILTIRRGQQAKHANRPHSCGRETFGGCGHDRLGRPGILLSDSVADFLDASRQAFERGLL
jgi:hypothetical protein